MKIAVWLVVAVMAVSMMSCGKKGADSVVVKVKSAWIPKNLGLMNPPEKSGIVGDLIYYTEEASDKFIVHFVDQTGVEKSNVMIKRGKGPGEIAFIMAMRVVGDKMYMYDVGSQKVLITDLQGKYLDDVAMKDQIGSFGALDIMDGYLYYHAMMGNKISKVNLSNGTLEKGIPWENPITDFQNLGGKEFSRGIVRADVHDKKFYIAYWNEPYRLEVYSTDLVLEKTLTRPLSEQYEKAVFAQGGQGLNGNILVSSIDADKNYIYASFGGGQKMTGSTPQDFKIEGIAKKYYLSVFDKKTGEFTREIFVENFETLNGVANIIGVTEQSIFLLVVDFGASLSKVVVQDDKDKDPMLKQMGISYGIIVIDNPMYDTVKK